ncbi:OmpA family protein [Crenobacter sp. SG2305]|uniref:OmpA family protein n=1 Tax=Crenobacter oryzisoli TaxID=3056844 RepID=UPI0025AB3273|nr:OmpA family protein [Crenobacter sp. SG2305]MDN0083512.1 OmpA family protein [Crenobacter sp. SG2305]
MQLTRPALVFAVVGALAASACTTNPQTGQSEMSKTAMYGLGAAAACGIVGGLTHGSRGARNAALGCGAVGAGVGAYMDYQEKLLRDKLANTQVQVQRVGDQIKLVMPENITFPVNRYDVNTGAQKTLGDVAGVLTQYPDTTITVAGHTDSTGTAQYNQTLSQRRAQAVAGILENRGVATPRVNAVGYGPAQPVADNTTAAGRAKNRRVEILINPKTA